MIQDYTRIKIARIPLPTPGDVEESGRANSSRG